MIRRNSLIAAIAVAMTLTVPLPVVPAAFQPTCHIFYGMRVMDVNDDLPKYRGHKGNSPLWNADSET